MCSPGSEATLDRAAVLTPQPHHHLMVTLNTTHLSIAVLVEKFESFVNLFGEVSLHLPQLHHRHEFVKGNAPAPIGVHLGLWKMISGGGLY